MASKRTISDPRTVPPRQYHIDNFRTFLTLLVIYHHTSIAYGGEGSVHYRSRHHPSPSLTLLLFNAFNQTFFMAAFFFMSAHFTHECLVSGKKSPRQLLLSRLMRLGVPTIAYTLLAEPLHSALLKLFLYHEPVSWSLVTDDWRSIRGIRGPVWYCGLVLIFDIVYIILRPISAQLGSTIKRNSGEDGEKDVQDSISFRERFGIVGLLSVTSVCDFVVRLAFPATHVFTPLNLRLGFLPQYILYYYLGTGAPSLNLSQTVTPSERRILGSLSLCTISVILAALWSSSGPADKVLRSAGGGLNLFAASYAVWSETTGFLIFDCLLKNFRRHANFPFPIWTQAPQYSYTAFLVHRPVSEFVEISMDAWQVGAVTKTFVVGSVSVLASWLVGFCASYVIEITGFGRGKRVSLKSRRAMM